MEEHRDHTSLYSANDKLILKNAEDALNPCVDRIQEIIDYAKVANIDKIGVAYCVSVTKEAERLEAILANEGLIVEKVHCKYGKVPFANLVEGYKGTSCNPAGQAKYLADKGTQLNIMMGLCVGHDMIFNQKSAAPVSPLVVKDRKLKHQTVNRLRE